MRELASGIDAFYMSGRCSADETLWDDLVALRSEAQEEDSSIPFAGSSVGFAVRPRGWLKYRVALEHEYGVVGVTNSRHLPALRVQPRAHFLHAVGPGSAVEWFRDSLEELFGPVRLSVTRIDLFSDWTGWTIHRDLMPAFVTYGRARVTYEEDDGVTGFQFGRRTSGTIGGRIYDKTNEIQTKPEGAYWVDIWGDQYRPGDQVVRVEFECHRELLQSFGLRSPEEVFAATPSLWWYATSQWLSLREPTTDETRSRWPVASAWQEITRSALSSGAIGIERVRERQRLASIEALKPALTGYLASVGALLGSEDLSDALTATDRLVRSYGVESGIGFGERVELKRRRGA
jgi:hypothetical protein